MPYQSSVRLDVCRTAATVTAERRRAGVIGESVGVAHHSAHRLGQLELVDLVLHVGHAVASDGVEDLLRLLCHSLLNGSSVDRAIVVDRVNAALCSATAFCKLGLRLVETLLDGRAELACLVERLIAEAADRIVILSRIIACMTCSGFVWRIMLTACIADCKGFGFCAPPNRLLAIVDRLPQVLHRCIELVTRHILLCRLGLVFNRLKCKSTDSRETGTIRAFNIHDVVVCVEQGHDGVGRHLVCLGPVHTSDMDQLHTLLHLSALLKLLHLVHCKLLRCADRLICVVVTEHHAFSNH